MMYLSDILLVVLGYVAGVVTKAMFKVPDNSYEIGCEKGKQDEHERIMNLVEERWKGEGQ